MIKNLLTRLSLTKEGKLMRYALGGNLAGVRQLLSQGVDPNTKTNAGYTALMGASLRGHNQIVKILLDAGADPNIR